MNLQGLALASRYSYPPNSLSLCGPEKQTDLQWYAENQKPDKGTAEILSQFATLYPYLVLIAGENRFKDAFDPKVVEAYWLGNNLLDHVPLSPFVQHLDDAIGLKKKIKRAEREQIFTKLAGGALPHHSFHVMNVYKRTGHLDIPHTVQTMDACIINWGKVIHKNHDSLVVKTKPLTRIGNTIGFGLQMERTLRAEGDKDTVFSKIKVGDVVSYHWGYVCEKLTPHQVKNLIHYTNLSLKYAQQ